MSTHPSSHFSPSPRTPSPRLAEVLRKSLETALAGQCAQRYDAEVSVQILDISSDETLKMRLQVQCRSLTKMPVKLTLKPAGGNIYDVLCTVEDGNSHRFSYSLPGPTETKLSHAPYLGQELATFLREELEKRLGRLLLQSPARRPTQTASILP